jgi:hypothetical protein
LKLDSQGIDERRNARERRIAPFGKHPIVWFAGELCVAGQLRHAALGLRPVVQAEQKNFGTFLQARRELGDLPCLGEIFWSGKVVTKPFLDGARKVS